MSSLVRSFASIYCQKLRSTTQLGPAPAKPRFHELGCTKRFLASGGPAATGRQYEREGTGFFTWARLTIASVFTAVLHYKWVSSFLRIQGEVEAVKDAAEAVADVVEEAATLTEKVSAEVAEQLPEGGRLRPVAELVEHTSKEVAEEAHLAKDIIHKVDEIEEDVKGIIEPLVDHGTRAQGKKTDGKWNAQQRSDV